MTTLMQADIFFFITSIAIVISTILLCVVVWYVVRILRDVQHVTQKLRDATDGIENKFESIQSFIRSYIPGRRKKKASPSSKIKVGEDTV